MIQLPCTLSTRIYTRGTLLLSIFFLWGMSFNLPAGEKPNVLFFFVDDLRPELGSYGARDVQTPEIDRLAESSLQFQRAYCQIPVCGASRASLMTGMFPTNKRFLTYFARADEDAPKARTLPQVFKEAGYTTISNGKVFHIGADSGDRSWSRPAWRPQDGYRKALDPATMATPSKRERGLIAEKPDVPDEAYADGQIAARTIEDLNTLKDSGQPFFLACGFLRPHLPFYAPKKYWDLYPEGSIRIADNRYRPENAPQKLRGSREFRSYQLKNWDLDSEEFHLMMRHGYLASVSYVDALIGKVLEALEELELEESTIVVLWGDHGFHLGEHNFWGKHNTMHLSTRVPLIIRVPGKSTGKTEALVETTDLFSTLCDLAGLEIPNTVQGRSFVQLFDQPEQPFREEAFSRYGNKQAGLAVITDRYSYTRYRNTDQEMLYDLKEDPDENVNVAGDPKYAEVLKDLRKRLERRVTEAEGVPFPTE